MISLRYKNNRSFYHLLFVIALPIVIQNFISSSLNLVDNVMIGQLGATHIAAVGLANQFYFIMTLILFGTNSGVSIYIAQFWGNKEHEKIKGVLSIGLLFGLFISAVFFVLGFFFATPVMSIMSDDQALIKLGASYLKIVSVSYMITAISFAFGFSSRSIGKSKLPMYASVISLLVNTFLNYALIFGHFSFPKLGIQGAAIATLVARSIELLIILMTIYKSIDVLAVKIRDIKDISTLLIKKLFKTAFPVIINETFWAIGMTVYTYIYAHVSTDAVASVQIANIINNLFFVVSMGLGNASSVMLGNQLGEGNIKTAKAYNAKFLALAFISGLVICFIILVSAPVMIQTFFKLTPSVSLMAIKTIRTISLLMPFKFFTTIVIIGTLRSGGDTLYSMVLELGCVWLIGVPMAYFTANILQLPIYIVVGLVGLEEISKTIISLPRIISGKWAKRIVD